MKLENSFEVPADPEKVWDFLLNVEGIVPCMPGAELTEVVDERTWKGRVRVKVGPVAMTYRGQVVMEERDDDVRRVVLRADGSETGGKGTASASVVSRVEPRDGGGSKVLIEQDLTLSGPAAQYGRGMIGDVSKRLTSQFADCLRQRLDSAEAREEPSARAEEVGGIRLAVWTLWQAIRRTLRRLAGRGGGEA